uniref:Uncharacterized protein n=1 Tax=Cacopsylla melanoneura TaxID=428564 RepID=A0A8D9E8L8_9HEMI
MNTRNFIIFLSLFLFLHLHLLLLLRLPVLPLFHLLPAHPLAFFSHYTRSYFSKLFPLFSVSSLFSSYPSIFSPLFLHSPFSLFHISLPFHHYILSSPFLIFSLRLQNSSSNHTNFFGCFKKILFLAYCVDNGCQFLGCQTYCYYFHYD